MQTILTDLVRPADALGSETKEREVSSSAGGRPFAEHLREETRDADRAELAKAEADARPAPRRTSSADRDEAPADTRSETPREEASPGQASSTASETGRPDQTDEVSSQSADGSGGAVPTTLGQIDSSRADIALAFAPGILQGQLATGQGTGAATPSGAPETPGLFVSAAGTGGTSQLTAAQQAALDAAATPVNLAAGPEADPSLDPSLGKAAPGSAGTAVADAAATLASQPLASPGGPRLAANRPAAGAQGSAPASEGQTQASAAASLAETDTATPSPAQAGLSKNTATAAAQANTQTPDSLVQAAMALASAKQAKGTGAALRGAGETIAAPGGLADLASGMNAGSQAALALAPAAIPGSGQIAASVLPGAAGQSQITLAQQPAEQVVIGIHKAVGEGRGHVSLRLYPAELGRIDVRIELAEDGVLRTVITADKSDTLEMLQRDARGLERALQEAGLKTDSGSLRFDQRGCEHDARDTDESQPNETDGGAPAPLEEGVALAALSQHSVHHGLLDLSV